MNPRRRASAPGDAAVDAVVDRGLLPDRLLRAAIRRLLRRRLSQELAGGVEAWTERKRARLAEWSAGPVTMHADAANVQHYEVPAAFFELLLGPRRKYSSAWWSAAAPDLVAAEEAMLEITAQRALLADGQDVLDLGCGWGSFTLWAAERYPASRFTAVSNSTTQRDFIAKQVVAAGLDNVTVLTRDVTDLAFESGSFDRVVSIEMFEHVRNHAVLLARIRRWLRVDGRLFVHVFAHRDVTYPFAIGARGDWMARWFFTGGVMPSDDLLLHLQDDLVAEGHWAVGGEHYARTLDAWLERLDNDRAAAIDVLAEGRSTAEATRAFHRWRVFLLACSELFAFDHGNQWHVSHYRFRPRTTTAGASHAL